MPTAVLAALRCPLCAAALSVMGSTLGCRDGHRFDIAKQGYAHLGTGRKLPVGDDLAMVTAREQILAAGYFTPLAEAIGQAAADLCQAAANRGVEPSNPATPSTSVAELDGKPPLTASITELGRDARPATPSTSGTQLGALVVELGAGTGYYLAAALDAMPGGYGLAFDVSKPALRRAAKAHARATAVLADTWGPLPMADAQVDVLLNVFAPRNGPEMHRVLRRDGMLLVATPTADHLRELRVELGLLDVDPAKDERLNRSLPEFELIGDEVIEWTMSLRHEAVTSLVGMGPSARHVGRALLSERLAGLAEPLPVTASVRLTRWRRRGA